MILEFSITNFRSIKDTTVFSMVAEPSKARSQNVFVHKLPNDDTVRVLKAAVIYGGNGSGKSNILRAFYYLLSLINDSKVHHSYKLKAGDPIWQYDPFNFDENSLNKPIEFILTFIGPEKIKYLYKVSYNSSEIINEELSYFPKGKETNLFKRTNEKDKVNRLIHFGKLGPVLNNKDITVFHNKLLLSKFGEDEPNELLTNVYVHLNLYDALNTHNPDHKKNFSSEVNKLFTENENFRTQLNHLINRSDIKIKNISINKVSLKGDTDKTDGSRSGYSLYGIHDNFKGLEKIGQKQLPFSKESTGTNTLYLLGGKMLDTINKGGVIFIDELETSLHPELSKMLIDLFQSEITNPKGAQLVFTTHDISLLAKSMFRKDQIWFTEKDDFGKTDLYSAQDFKEAREDTPFDRWYIAGKFGALPYIKPNDNSVVDNSEGNAQN